MSAGQIVEHVSPTELLERHGFCDDLYSSQFRDYAATRRVNPAGTSFGFTETGRAATVGPPSDDPGST